MTSLFTECFGAEGCSNNEQPGCTALVGASLVEELKKSILNATAQVIKSLKLKQTGRGKRKQKGAGAKKQKPKQKGAGVRRKKQKKQAPRRK
jgi:hypothetical protein